MSNQNVATPTEFVRAIEDKIIFDEFACDMAADKYNHKAPFYFTEKCNSLAINWPLGCWLWLNPTFINLTDWIDKCKEQKARGCKTVTIWPLSSDSNQLDVWMQNRVIIVHGRIWPLNVRSCMLTVWDNNAFPGISHVSWDRSLGVMEWLKR